MLIHTTGHSLIQFLRDCVVSFLEDETPAIRKEAALTCAHLLLRTHENLAAGNMAGVAISVQVCVVGCCLYVC